jgi:hypothetical protein
MSDEIKKPNDNNDQDLDFQLELEEIPSKEPEVIVAHEDEPIKEEKLADREVISPDDGIKQLRMELEQQKLRAIEAERRAREYSEKALQAENEVQDTNLHLIKTALENTKRDEAILKARLRDAFAIGDHDTAADLQAQLATNAAKAIQLENGASALANKPRQTAPEYNPAPKDEVEAFAEQLSPRSANWIRQHPEYVTNKRLQQKMLAAHNLVTADGIRADTDEYFQQIENVLGVQRAQQEDSYSDASERAAPRRREAPPAAPPSRGSNGTGSRPTVVRLTAAEREMAQMMDMTDKEYAQHKAALMKEGKLH